MGLSLLSLLLSLCSDIEHCPWRCVGLVWRMLLCIGDAMCGAEMPVAIRLHGRGVAHARGSRAAARYSVRYALSGTDVVYRPMRCLVLVQRIVQRSRDVLSGTDKRMRGCQKRRKRVGAEGASSEGEKRTVAAIAPRMCLATTISKLHAMSWTRRKTTGSLLRRNKHSSFGTGLGCAVMRLGRDGGVGDRFC
eukprot:33362-Rhodomonas_salina.4